MDNPAKRNKNLSLYTCPKGQEKKIGYKILFYLSFAQTNFLISQQNLHFDFKNAWKMLAKVADPALAGEAANPQNFDFEKLRYLLDEIRTFFAENPNSDF